MDKCPPDLYDVLGSLVIVAGVETIMYWPRGRLKERLAGRGKQFELKREGYLKKVLFDTLSRFSHVPRWRYIGYNPIHRPKSPFHPSATMRAIVGRALLSWVKLRVTSTQGQML
jgi:hypothetical protein